MATKTEAMVSEVKHRIQGRLSLYRGFFSIIFLSFSLNRQLIDSIARLPFHLFNLYYHNLYRKIILILLDILRSIRLFRTGAVVDQVLSQFPSGSHRTC